MSHTTSFGNQSGNWLEEDTAACYQNAKGFRKGITSYEAVQHYSIWAEGQQYDQDLRPGRYNGPMIAARAVAEYFPEDRDQKRVIDIAAGTGFVGQNLQDLGFKKVDALEPSTKMLSKAIEKGLYQNCFTDFLSEDALPIDEDTYDCAVICGGMGEGHIPCSGIQELIRITKPGGLICIVMREEYLYEVEEYKDRLEPMMFFLEMAGKWKRVSRVTVPGYFISYPGVLFMYCVI